MILTVTAPPWNWHPLPLSYSSLHSNNIHVSCLHSYGAKLIHSTSFAGAHVRNHQKPKGTRSQPSLRNRTVDIDGFAHISSIQNCKSVKQVKEFHAHILRNGLHQNVFLQTKLAGMYEEYGRMGYARLVFERTEATDVFFWNVMIRGYARNGPYEEAIALYYEMRSAGLQPNKFTFPFVLKACAALSALEEGMEIHNHIRTLRLESDVYVGAALVDMYGKCGKMDDARQMFDKMPERNLVAWTAIITGYTQNGEPIEALRCFKQMQVTGMKPDSVAVGSAVLACACLESLEYGEMLHGYVIKRGFESFAFVATGFVDMYAKCRNLESARQVFDKMPKRNVVSWNAMISGYGRNGYAKEAVALFKQMNLVLAEPNSVTMLCVLPECAHLAYLHSGEQIHCYVIKRGFESDVFVGNSLIDMYARCGKVDIARKLFESMPKRDVVSWNAMITGYAIHGCVEDVISLFSQMQEAGVKANHITFVSVLSACSHAGLMDKAWQYFDCMSQNYGIVPQVEHYACMIDLLGRSGHLVEAQNFIKKMPLEPSATVWGTLFHACRVRSNVEIGQHVAERLFELEPENAQCSVLLSNIYARAGRWSDLKKVIMTMKDETKSTSLINCI